MTEMSPEIEKLLADGPEPVNWDEISEELKELYLGKTARDPVVPSVTSVVETLVFGNTAGGGLHRPAVAPAVRGGRPVTSVVETLVFGTTAGSGSSSVVEGPVQRRKPPCSEWVCLAGRNVTVRSCAVSPVIYTVTTSLPQLVEAGDPWVTFSRASVAELNRMGIDNAFTVHGSTGRASSGIVVYRGTSDSEVLVDSLTKDMFRRIDGAFRYVTAVSDDASQFAVAVTHMCSSGGRVCDARDSPGCRWCEDTGKITYTADGEPYGTTELGSYCSCSKGEWLEVRDEEFDEWNSGGFVMGWSDERGVSPGRGTPSPRRSHVNLSDKCGGRCVATRPSVHPPPVGVEEDRQESASGESMGNPGVRRGGLQAAAGVTQVAAAVSRGIPMPSGHVGRASALENLPWRAIAEDAVAKTALTESDIRRDMTELISNCESATLSALMRGGPPSSPPEAREVCEEWTYSNITELLEVSVVDVSVEDRLPDGQCYLAVVHSSYSAAAAARLSVWPSVADLMQSPAVWFSMVQLTRARVSLTAEGVAHIGFSSAGFSLFESVVALARSNTKVGSSKSLAGLARAISGDVGTLGSVNAVSVRTKLGAGGGEDTLRKWLGMMSALGADKFTDDDMYIVSRSAALLNRKGKDRLKILESVGDSALTLVVAARCEKGDYSAEDYQAARSVITSNTALTDVFMSVVPKGTVMFAADVRPNVGKVGASAFEVLVGLVYLRGGMKSVTVFCEVLGVLDKGFSTTGCAAGDV